MRIATFAPRSAASALALLLIGATLLLSSPWAHAQWKWRDARGQVHVSDMPPPRDVVEKDILQRPNQAAQRPVTRVPATSAASAAASAPALAIKPAEQTELDKRIKAAEKEQADKAKIEEEKAAARRADNCKRARSHLTTIESGMRIAQTNDKGEREILDDKQRAEEMRRAREVIASDCR
jgi:hypothetical protein